MELLPWSTEGDEETEEEELVNAETLAAVKRLPGPPQWQQGALAVIPRQPADEELEEFRRDTHFVLCEAHNHVAQAWARERFLATDGGASYIVSPASGEPGETQLTFSTTDPHLRRAKREDPTLEPRFLAAFEAHLQDLLLLGAVRRIDLPQPDLPGYVPPGHGWCASRASLRRHFAAELGPHLPSEEQYWKDFLSKRPEGGVALFVPLQFWVRCAAAPA